MDAQKKNTVNINVRFNNAGVITIAGISYEDQAILRWLVVKSQLSYVRAHVAYICGPPISKDAEKFTTFRETLSTEVLNKSARG